MKVEELCIGDYVNYEGKPVRVKGLCSMVTFEINEHLLCTCGAVNLDPIPLTPEILEKNGFEKNSECCWRNSAIECACLRYGTKYWDIRINGRNRAYRPTRISIDNILHTHQLQNVLRLAGIEKEIELI